MVRQCLVDPASYLNGVFPVLLWKKQTVGTMLCYCFRDLFNSRLQANGHLYIGCGRFFVL